MAKRKPMDAQAKSRWLEALRSGKYQQGREFLFCYSAAGPRHCCLGVLQEVMGFPLDEEHRPTNTLLLPECARAAGLPSPREAYFESVSDANVQKRLANMNTEGRTFAQIADWIEEHL